MTRNKCRLAACLCTESLWRESFISTIATLFCKFSFAESRCSFPEKRELYLVTSQLILVPSASLILQHSALSLIQTFTTLIASLNFCCPTSYWIPRSSQFCNMEITLSVKRELDSILSRSIVSKETDVGYKYSVKNLHSTPVAVLKRRRFNSQTSFCQFQIPFLNTFCCLFLLKNKWLYAVTRKPWEVRGLPFHAACMVWAGRFFPKENRRRARSLSLLSGACAWRAGGRWQVTTPMSTSCTQKEMNLKITQVPHLWCQPVPVVPTEREHGHLATSADKHTASVWALRCDGSLLNATWCHSGSGRQLPALLQTLQALANVSALLRFVRGFYLKVKAEAVLEVLWFSPHRKPEILRWQMVTTAVSNTYKTWSFYTKKKKKPDKTNDWSQINSCVWVAFQSILVPADLEKKANYCCHPTLSYFIS